VSAPQSGARRMVARTPAWRAKRKRGAAPREGLRELLVGPAY
jgi:hypothetical protein